MHAMNEIHFCKFNSNKNILDLKMSLIAICMFPNICRGMIFKLNKTTFSFNQYRYAKEFLETRLFFGTDQWTKNQTLVIFSEQTFLPWIMGEGDFIVGNRRVRI